MTNTQPTPDSPIRRAAQQDPQVQAAMRQIAEGRAALDQALTDLGARTPRLAGFLLPLGPGLAAVALRQTAAPSNQEA